MSERAEASETAFWEDADDTEALRRYRTLMSQIGDGIYRLDSDGRFVAVNDALVEATGYERSELVGSHVSTLLDADDASAVEREIERRRAGSGGRNELLSVTVRTADGDRIPCELRVNSVEDDGGFRGSTGVVRDLTDRPRVDRPDDDREAERLEPDATEQVLDASPVGVVARDADGTVTRANDRASAMLGVSEGGGPADGTAERPLYDERGRAVPADERPFAQVLETGEPVSGRILQVERAGDGVNGDDGSNGIRPDDDRRWLSVSAAPVSTDDAGVARVVTTYEDVTPVKKRERELETELDEVFGRVTDAFYALDDRWRLTHANQRAEELIDYRDEGLVGRNFWEVFEWATDSKLGEEYRTAMETQEPTSFEFYYPEPLESWYEVHAYPSETGLSVYFRDVTDRKERERTLQEREEQLSRLMDNVPGMVYRCRNEREWPMEFVSDACRDLTGYDPEALERGEVQWGTDVIVEADRDDVWSELQAATADREPFSITYRIETTDGETRWVRDYGRSVFDDDGELIALEGIISDVTERKRLETELRASERRHRALAEYFPNGIVTLFDHDLEYTLAAGQAFDYIPVEPDEVEGKNFHAVWDDPIAEALEPAFEAALDGEERSVELEYVGREWVVHGVPITDEGGDVFAGMTMAQDITERKERERKLEETVEKLEASNERLESFASMLAHELRNPVTIGQIYTQQLPAETDSEAAEYITEAFDRIEEMIDVMLVLTRGREAVGDCSRLSLADVAREAWEEVDTPETTLTVEIDESIRADRTYLRHLFRNLFENAMQHGDADVVRIGETSAGFYVADDGTGIQAEDEGTVFEAGFTTAADEGGTGLGLAFVQELADVYDWTCTATETESGGARFEFRDVSSVSEA